MIEWKLLAPPDLEAHNVNAVGGEPYGGPAGLDDALLWRGGSRGHRTSVKGLWQIGAGTHPGPGTGAGSGGIVAREVLRRSRRRR